MSKHFIISDISLSDHVKSWANATLLKSLRVMLPFPASAIQHTKKRMLKISGTNGKKRI